MQEFLAINSDLSTYFGRKPVVKSKIDKVRIHLHTVDNVKRVRQKHSLYLISKHFFDKMRDKMRNSSKFLEIFLFALQECHCKKNKKIRWQALLHLYAKYEAEDSGQLA